MRRSILFILVAALSLAGRLQAGVTITLLDGQFTFANGTTPVPNGSLLLLVADTQQNGFGSLVAGNLNAGSFTNGLDDQILFRTTVNTGLGSSSVSDTFNGTLGGAWNAGDPLAIIWFSTLTGGSTAVTGGTAYGFFTTSSPQDLSDSWVTPSDGAAINLNFLTNSVSGSYADNLGATSLTVIPEPATYAAIAGLGVLGLAVYRRRAWQG